jgi:hypothetical protein
MMALHIFHKQLQSLGFNLDQILGEDNSQDGLTFMDVTAFPIIQALKNFWSE